MSAADRQAFDAEVARLGATIVVADDTASRSGAVAVRSDDFGYILSAKDGKGGRYLLLRTYPGGTQGPPTEFKAVSDGRDTRL